MCGLVGIAGKLEFKDEDTMRRLLLVDYIRGTDSTGLGAIRENGEVLISKIASHPIDLFDSSTFKKALSGYNSKAFIGHNRAATLGKVSGLNAHPFQYDNIMGAHNGTLDTQSWLRLEEAADIKTDVDSAAIFACIAKVGVKDTIKLMEEGSTPTRGAWALTWFDEEDNTINFLRNKHRPLWYCMTKDLNKILWASQHPMLQAATELGKTDEYELYEGKDGYCFFQFTEDWHYKFDLKDLAAGFEKKPVGKTALLRGREPVEVVTTTTPPFHHGGFGTGNVTNIGGRSNTSTVSDTLTLEGTPQLPYAGLITKDEFESMSKFGGCAWCGEKVEFTDVGVSVYEGAGVVLCPEHSGNGCSHNRIYSTPTEYSKHLKIANV